MKGGIIKRGSTWTYVVRVDDPATGTMKAKWVGGFRTRKEAAAARDADRHATNRGTYVARQAMTLGEWLTKWLDLHAVQVKPSTVASYRTIVRAYILPYPIARTRVQALTPSAFSTHWIDVQATGGKGGKPLSARTVRYGHSIVRKALTDAVADRMIEINPAVGAKLPRVESAAGREPDAWSPDALRAFLDATRDDRWSPLWMLMAYTGMRRGEALAMRWSDADLDAGELHIRRSMSDVDGRIVFNDAPKNGEWRTVAAPPAAVAALRSWRKAQAAEQLQAGPAWQETEPGLIFTTPTGAPVTPGTATKAFGKSVKATGAPALTLHGLRHTAATLLLRDGASVHLVAKMLGHKDPTVTLSVYSHAIPGDDSMLAGQLASIIGS